MNTRRPRRRFRPTLDGLQPRITPSDFMGLPTSDSSEMLDPTGPTYSAPDGGTFTAEADLLDPTGPQTGC